MQQETAAAVVLPTRMTNIAGATKAQIAPFSSESQQLQGEIRAVSEETHSHLISNVLNLKKKTQLTKQLKESVKRLMNFESKRRDSTSGKSSFSPHTRGIQGGISSGFVTENQT